MALLDELTEAAAAVAGRVGPAVVGVGHGWGHGSGLIVGDGLVLTNAHNLGGAHHRGNREHLGPDAGWGHGGEHHGGEHHGGGHHGGEHHGGEHHGEGGAGGQVTVTFLGGRTAEGEVRAADVDGDLAVLAVEPEATAGVTPLEWPTEPARLGTPVFALSNPGGRGLRVTFGTISALDQAFRGPRGRPVTGALEHTAPLPRGSSGGPVVDAGGRLLGLDVNRLGEGFYLAIPADAALRARVDALAAGTPPRATYRHLGVSVAPPAVARKLRAAVGLPERDGLLVRAVASDGPASRAGLRTGDLIVEIGGRAATSVDVLYQALAEPAGDRLALVILRGTETVEATVDFTGPTDRDDR